MSVTDYVVDILLILVIFRAVRPHRLTPRAALLPLVLLIVALALTYVAGIVASRERFVDDELAMSQPSLDRKPRSL